MKIVKFLALILVVIGAINWGLWGVFQFDLVAALFGGNMTAISRLVYSLIGLAGIISLSFFGCVKCICGCCGCSKSGKGGGSCKM